MKNKKISEIRYKDQQKVSGRQNFSLVTYTTTLIPNASLPLKPTRPTAIVETPRSIFYHCESVLPPKFICSI